MKYIPPRTGHYESGLTAKLLYAIVDGLIKEHVTSSDIERLRQTPSLGLIKLWDKPEIRGRLEEFVQSYLFTDPVHGFQEVVNERDASTRNHNLQAYFAAPEKHYGSRETAYKESSRLFGELEKRGTKFMTELNNVTQLKRPNIIKTNTNDSFGHIFGVPYGYIEISKSMLESMNH